MKKSLLALAVLGAFASTAMAQSSVSIYGLLSQGVFKSNDGTAPSAGVPGAAATLWNGAPGVANKTWQVDQAKPSRIGFRGNEDLGGGMSAQFEIEHRFTPDDGATAGVMWAGKSFVQLTGGFGSVYLGRNYAPTFWIALKSDPFNWVGVGQWGSSQWAGYGVQNGGVRTANVVGYKSPSFGGLTANVDVGAGEGRTSRAMGLNVEYKAGPLWAGLGYDRNSKGPAATDGTDLVNLGASYDFGMITPMLYFGRAKLNVAGGTATNKFLGLGATAPLGQGVLKAGISRLDPEGSGGNETKFGIGYDYLLSKRTKLFADIANARKSDQGLVTYKSRTSFDVGIQHDF